MEILKQFNLKYFFADATPDPSKTPGHNTRQGPSTIENKIRSPLNTMQTIMKTNIGLNPRILHIYEQPS